MYDNLFMLLFCLMSGEPMEVDRHVVAKNSSPISSDRVTTLKGHQSEVRSDKFPLNKLKLFHI